MDFGIDGKSQIDTYTGTYTKDLVMDGTMTIDFEIPYEIKVEIFDLMKEMDILSLPDNLKFDGIYVTPSCDYILKVTIDNLTKTIIWRDGLYTSFMKDKIPDDNRKFLKLVEYLQDYIYSTEEYKEMPKANGAYA